MFSFPKKERLCKRDRIKRLFNAGESFLCYPFVVRYVFYNEQGTNYNVLIVCPKRYQKTAVNRNRIKRLTREALRLNSHPLKQNLQEKKLGVDLSLSYSSKEMTDYGFVEQKIRKILDTLNSKLSQDNIPIHTLQ